MEDKAILAIDAFRERCRQHRNFYEEHGLGPGAMHGDLASIVLESLASTGSPALFLEVENEVRRLVLRDLRRFKRTGERELCYPHADRYQDGRGSARVAIATLFNAGLVSQSMTRIALPQQIFSGLELIGWVNPLRNGSPSTRRCSLSN